MGPLLVTGAACFGGAVGIGLITAAAARALADTTEQGAIRGLHLVLIATEQAIGVLGVVIGILAIVVAGVGDTTSAIVAAVPAVGGAVTGTILARHAGKAGIRTPLGLPFIGGLGLLGVVVAIEAVVIGKNRAIGAGDLPFAIVALVMLCAAQWGGVTGARGLERAARGRSEGPSGLRVPGTLEHERVLAIRNATVVQSTAIVAAIVAIALIVVGAPKAV
jgi:F0F1-type ATP synthase membrane subunit c/vacuolar-type H+-ATPase subunit K